LSALWFLPLAVSLVGVMAVFLAASRAAEEAGLMVGEFWAMAGLRPILAELQASIRALGDGREARRSNGC